MEDYLAVVSIAFYLTYGARELLAYRKWLGNNISDSTYPTFNWLRNVYVVGGILGLILFVNLGLDYFFNLRSWFYLHWEGYAIVMSAVIYYLGLVGYQQPDFEMISDRNVEKPYSHPQLEESKISEVSSVLKNAMEKDEVYLSPVLSIQELSKSLGIPQKTISIVINQTFNKNYRDFINQYRVEAVIRKLEQGDLQHLSILGIALDSGFNSEASFYRIFKKHTGKSPKEYKATNS